MNNGHQTGFRIGLDLSEQRDSCDGARCVTTRAHDRTEDTPDRDQHAFGRNATPLVDGGFAARQCTVIDISEGGTRLRVEDPQFVKPQFQLKFDRTSPGRACKVAWKKGDVIGIKFV